MKFRLDKVLEAIAKRGVKVYILIYKEVERALKIKSIFTKKELTKLSTNIKVIRHPRKLISFWSHHEKIVVIDQKIGFLGGIDLSFGRWDTPQHPLVDLPAKTDVNRRVFFPGMDYANSRFDDFKNVDRY